MEVVTKMAKKKIISDKEKSKEKKSYGRMPTAKPTEWFKDKIKYSRKKKHKKAHDEN
jgi:hypothetical protein